MRALFVVDMLRAFLEPRRPLYCGDEARKIIPFVRSKVEEFKKAGEPVYFICDSHDENDKEFERFPKHAVKGTEEARLIPELEDLSEGGVFIYKRRYSAFYDTVLDDYLRANRPDVVEVVGVCTNICVLYTVEELCNRDIRVRVFRQGVASFDKNAHEWALKQMEQVLGAEVV